MQTVFDDRSRFVGGLYHELPAQVSALELVGTSLIRVLKNVTYTHTYIGTHTDKHNTNTVPN